MAAQAAVATGSHVRMARFVRVGVSRVPWAMTPISRIAILARYSVPKIPTVQEKIVSVKIYQRMTVLHVVRQSSNI